MDPVSAPGTPAGESEVTGHTVTVEDLWAHHGDQAILRGVDLTLAPGEVTALVGPSGSGKTTLLRCINRMHEEVPRARVVGTIRLDGEDIYGPGVDRPTVRRLIGMVFQKATPFPTMSVSDDVATGLRLAGVRGSEVRDRVEDALRAVGLWEEVRDRLAQPGGGLSEGQQQRLCIARALAADPDVLLLDEPCTALDPIATLRVEELIARLRSRYTIALVTHTMQQAARVADTTAFLSDGELVEHAPTSVLFTRPRDERTERFLTGKFN